MNQKLPSFTVPLVEKLEIRVVVDSFYDRFLPKFEHEFVEISHPGRQPGKQMTSLAGEWGLSLHLIAYKHTIKTEYLLDFGYTPEIISRNVNILGINPQNLDGLILSHGHRDHFGGLDGFVKNFRTSMKDDINLYVGGETVFREKWLSGEGTEPLPWGALDMSSLTALNIGHIC